MVPEIHECGGTHLGGSMACSTSAACASAVSGTCSGLCAAQCSPAQLGCSMQAGSWAERKGLLSRARQAPVLGLHNHWGVVAQQGRVH